MKNATKVTLSIFSLLLLCSVFEINGVKVSIIGQFARHVKKKIFLIGFQWDFFNWFISLRACTSVLTGFLNGRLTLILTWFFFSDIDVKYSFYDLIGWVFIIQAFRCINIVMHVFKLISEEEIDGEGILCLNDGDLLALFPKRGPRAKFRGLLQKLKVYDK